MGRVPRPIEFQNGLPADHGIDHMRAAKLFLSYLRTSHLTRETTRATILGSTATGNADELSDVDYFVVRKSLEGEAGIRQRLFIEGARRYASSRYRVHFEGTVCDEDVLRRDLIQDDHAVTDSLWVAHGVNIEDEHPEWSYREPFGLLRENAINIEKPKNSEEITLIAAIAIRYFKHKERMFSEAGVFDPANQNDYLVMQRGFETAKAYVRKMLGFSSLEGYVISHYDVTSKVSMQEEGEKIITRIDESGLMKHYTDLILNLNAKYRELVKETVKSQDIDKYTQWLGRHYLIVCGAALRLTQLYSAYIDGVTLAHPEVNFWKYGIDLDSEYDEYDERARTDNEPGSKKLIILKPKTIIREPVFINMSTEEIDCMLRNAQDYEAASMPEDGIVNHSPTVASSAPLSGVRLL